MTDLKKLAEPFPESDTEWRIGQSGTKGDGTVWARVLAYVTARAVMSRLDDVCGPAGWQVEYQFIGERGVTCRIGILVDGVWVWKQDGAEMTDIESFKGGISGAFKRAGSAWGIGRYLYQLESGWAHTSPKEQDGHEWAQTKDKKVFYWAPPALPAWALPKGTPVVGTGGPKSVAPKAKTSTPPVTPQGRTILLNQIMDTAAALGVSDDELGNWAQDEYGKGSKQMSDDELTDFLSKLQVEIGRKGEIA